MPLPRRPLIRCTMTGGPSPAPRGAGDDQVAALRALAGLRENGRLTDREFAVLAVRVLAGPPVAAPYG
ncbi:MAG TPA: hypothetical protein VGL93_14220 [Streptosporangiaceae bacterium]|jgi:hypothetical protein